MKDAIYIHLPAYREPELVPTIKDAIKQASNPERLVFGICRQYNPEDGFDDLSEFDGDSRFKVNEMLYTEARGLPYARFKINEMITDEDYILQLDSHHRFVKGWDKELVSMHKNLEKKHPKPLLTGYLPYYNPKNPADRTMEPWMQQFVCFYPHGTIFIRPKGIHNWKKLDAPIRSRFISGHFVFGRTSWAKEILHDPDLYFSGEEINLTVRSFTSGYDLFHPHKLLIWHATMREERDGMLLWDDQHKRGIDSDKFQAAARAKIRQLFGVEDNGFDLTGFDLGTERTIHDYEEYAGVDFKTRSVQQYTLDDLPPPNPKVENWEESLIPSHYINVVLDKTQFKLDDYAFWLCAFDDKDGIGLYSENFSKEEVKEIMAQEGTWFFFERYFAGHVSPVRLVVWSYSESQGWAERVEFPVI
jgi:hypothetical protein